jgi:hypothetical protein
MAYMQIAVRLGRKARDHLPGVLAAGEIGLDDLTDEVGGGRGRRLNRVGRRALRGSHVRSSSLGNGLMASADG